MKPPVVPETCGGCKFFRKPPDTPAGSGIVRPGICKRFPRNEDKTPADWCGEWKKGV